MAEAAPAEQPPLTLKVLRLTRPGLAIVREPYAPAGSPLADRTNALQPVLPHLGLTAVAMLPSSFGSIGVSATEIRGSIALLVSRRPGAAKLCWNLLSRFQLGETFNATVVLGLVQDAASSPRAIRLHVEIQAPSGTRSVLLERKADGLVEDQALESQITHEVKEIGLHALVCSIAYRSGPDDAPDRQLRKLYRFTASSPCSVKCHGARTPISLLSPEREVSHLEVQITNTSPGPLLFDEIRLDIAEGLTFVDANVDAASSRSIFASPHGSAHAALLEPGDIRQLVYTIRPIEAAPSRVFAAAQRNATLQLGKLDIAWRTAQGEPGRLQTSTLARRMPPLPPPRPQPVEGIDVVAGLIAELSVVERPTSVKANRPFEVKLALHLSLRALGPALAAMGARTVRMVLALQTLSVERGPDRVAADVASAIASPTSDTHAPSRPILPRPVIYAADAADPRSLPSPTVRRVRSSAIALGEVVVTLPINEGAAFDVALDAISTRWLAQANHAAPIARIGGARLLVPSWSIVGEADEVLAVSPIDGPAVTIRDWPVLCETFVA